MTTVARRVRMVPAASAVEATSEVVELHRELGREPLAEALEVLGDEADLLLPGFGVDVEDGADGFLAENGATAAATYGI